MRNRKLLYTIYFGAILVLTAFTVSMRIAACLTGMNYATGYFDDKLLIDIADKTVIFASALALSYFFAESKDKKLIFNFSSSLNYVFAGTLGVALLFFSRHAFMLFNDYRIYVNKYDGALYYDVRIEKLLMYISFALGIFAALSVLHFLFGALIVKERNTRRADFGLITVLFLALYASYLYFNRELPINAPAKIIDQSAYLAASLFFLFETRISIGRERWRAYRAFGLLAMLLTAYSSIPSLIVYIAKGVTVSNSIYETVLTLALSLFIGARLVLTAMLKENKENKTVSLIKQAALEREAALNPTEEPYDSEADEAFEGMSVEDKGDYYELNFEEGSESASIMQETEDVVIEEDSGN